MARATNLHSRIVAWLKVILPLTALVSLSMIFLVSRTVNPEDAIPYARVDVDDYIREPRMTLPSYAGVTGDGSALTVTADEARPGADGTPEAGHAVVVRGRIETSDGAQTDLTAATAQIAPDGTQVLFSGGVTVTTSTGYRIVSPEMTAGLKVTEVASGGGDVRADGPLGNIRADEMRLTQDQGGYVLVFNGRVRLIYEPTE